MIQQLPNKKNNQATNEKKMISIAYGFFSRMFLKLPIEFFINIKKNKLLAMEDMIFSGFHLLDLKFVFLKNESDQLDRNVLKTGKYVHIKMKIYIREKFYDQTTQMIRF